MASSVGPKNDSGRMLTIDERKRQLGLGAQLGAQPAASSQARERSSSISTVSMGIKGIRKEEGELAQKRRGRSASVSGTNRVQGLIKKFFSPKESRQPSKQPQAALPSAVPPSRQRVQAEAVAPPPQVQEPIPEQKNPLLRGEWVSDYACLEKDQEFLATGTYLVVVQEGSKGVWGPSIPLRIAPNVFQYLLNKEDPAFIGYRLTNQMTFLRKYPELNESPAIDTKRVDEVIYCFPIRKQEMEKGRLRIQIPKESTYPALEKDCGKLVFYYAQQFTQPSQHPGLETLRKNLEVPHSEQIRRQRNPV